MYSWHWNNRFWMQFHTDDYKFIFWSPYNVLLLRQWSNYITIIICITNVNYWFRISCVPYFKPLMVVSDYCHIYVILAISVNCHTITNLIEPIFVYQIITNCSGRINFPYLTGHLWFFYLMAQLMVCILRIADRWVIARKTLFQWVAMQLHLSCTNPSTRCL